MSEHSLLEAESNLSELIDRAIAGEGVVMIRRLDLPLRAPDAIHLAIARRMHASLATFDAQLGRAARTLGVAVLS